MSVFHPLRRSANATEAQLRIEARALGGDFAVKPRVPCTMFGVGRWSFDVLKLEKRTRL
jgi:hypothetical protein